MCSVLVEVRERLFYRYYFRHHHVSWHPSCMLRSVLFLRRQCFIDGATYYVQSTRQHLPRAPTQPDRGRVRARKGKRNNGMRARAIAAGCSLWRTYPNSSLTLPFSSSFVAGYYCCRQAGGTCAASWSRGFSLASVFASACGWHRGVGHTAPGCEWGIERRDCRVSQRHAMNLLLLHTAHQNSQGSNLVRLAGTSRPCPMVRRSPIWW